MRCCYSEPHNGYHYPCDDPKRNIKASEYCRRRRNMWRNHNRCEPPRHCRLHLHTCIVTQAVQHWPKIIIRAMTSKAHIARDSEPHKIGYVAMHYQKLNRANNRARKTWWPTNAISTLGTSLQVAEVGHAFESQTAPTISRNEPKKRRIGVDVDSGLAFVCAFSVLHAIVNEDPGAAWRILRGFDQVAAMGHVPHRPGTPFVDVKWDYVTIRVLNRCGTSLATAFVLDVVESPQWEARPRSPNLILLDDGRSEMQCVQDLLPKLTGSRVSRYFNFLSNINKKLRMEVTILFVFSFNFDRKNHASVPANLTAK